MKTRARLEFIGAGDYEVPDGLQVGDLVTVTAEARVTRIEDDLVDVSSRISANDYLPGEREYRFRLSPGVKFVPVPCGHDGWQAGCSWCARRYRAAEQAMLDR